jgi:hypothetical protein
MALGCALGCKRRPLLRKALGVLCVTPSSRVTRRSQAVMVAVLRCCTLPPNRLSLKFTTDGL